ncbi:hypothetical protein GCM10025857_35750 [Alicyclobacillus contaminans]|nr:hypothetical protein [Alicyclobacillus contaminans]GMA52218.1 hypothetical protein GCM10025857_35750 [Alicyclobacillus contaminans]
MTSVKREKRPEAAIWALYQQTCKEAGKQPSLEDFKDWAARLVKRM